jgi:hypothetical protein
MDRRHVLDPAPDAPSTKATVSAGPVRRLTSREGPALHGWLASASNRAVSMRRAITLRARRSYRLRIFFDGFADLTTTASLRQARISRQVDVVFGLRFVEYQNLAPSDRYLRRNAIVNFAASDSARNAFTNAVLPSAVANTPYRRVFSKSRLKPFPACERWSISVNTVIGWRNSRFED